MSSSFESLPDHIRRPHLRPIQPIPVQSKDGKKMIALRDPAMLSQQTVVVPPQVLQVLPHFSGDRALDEIASQMNANVDQFVQLAEGLDKVGLLWGPTFERLEGELRERLEAEGAFPPGASQALGKTEDECRAALDGYFDETEDPELETAPIAIVAPHLDYQRGWPNYAGAYYACREAERPDRIVVLGTNHFGLGDGVVMTEFGFNTPLGPCPTDKEVVGRLIDRFGRPLIIDQLDHLPEHSIQLQLPWIQYCFGDVPVVAVLMPDPIVGLLEDDGERVGFDSFLGAFREVLDDAGGRTFYIASSDLSHVGLQFGEPRAVDEQRRIDVERHDRDMLGKFVEGDADEFISALKWNKNPTRWCSIGNMAALLKLTAAEEIELIDYRQAYDDEGVALVSSAALALM